MPKKKSRSRIHRGYKNRKYPTPAESRGRRGSSQKTKKQRKLGHRVKAVTFFVFGILYLVSMLIGFSPVLESVLMLKKAIIILAFTLGLYYYMISS